MAPDDQERFTELRSRQILKEHDDPIDDEGQDSLEQRYQYCK